MLGLDDIYISLGLRYSKGWMSNMDKGTLKLKSTLKQRFFFMIRCADGSLYADISENIEQSIRDLNSGRGRSEARTRRPVFLVYSEEYMNERDAKFRCETVRQLSRSGKEQVALEADSLFNFVA